MPIRTYPDYGRSESGFPSPDIDLTELAARTGSIDTLRRDGKVIYIDPFEILTWEFLGGGGTGSNAVITTLKKCRGFCSLELTPGTTAPYEANIQKYFPSLPNRRYGFEVTVANGDTTPGPGYTFELLALKFLGRSAAEGGFKIDYDAKKLYYYAAGGWQDLAGIFDPLHGLQWASVKIVLDFGLLQTVRLFWGEVVHNINFPMWQWTPASDQGDTMYITISLFDTNPLGRKAYLSDFIMSIDEP